MSKITWRNLSDEVLALNELIDNSINEETGEIQDSGVLEELESELIGKLQTKAESIVDVLHFQEDDIKAITEEINRLNDIKQVMQKKNANFKKYIEYNMKKMGVNEVKTLKGTLKLRKSTTCEIENENDIPNEYVKQELVFKIDKMAIKEALKKGIDVKGAFLQENLKLNVN